MKKKISIAFCDYHSPQIGCIFNILKKYYIVDISETPEYLFYSCYNNRYRYTTFSSAIKIFWTTENVRPDFNTCDYAIGFDYISFEDRYFRHSRFTKRDPLTLTPEELASRKFCNFIYSNTSAQVRQKFCQKLMQYKHVDCPGKVLNNMNNAIEPRNGNWAKGKLDFIQNYKFTIAFENSSTPGYVTEKLTQPLQANSVPIYWGDPAVTREFNPKAFINCHDFADFDEVIDYVKYLDTHDDAYLEMLHQPPMQPDYDPAEHDLEKFLIHIIEEGTPQPKDPHGCWAHKHEKNLALALDSVRDAVVQPLARQAGLDAESLFRELPFRPKDAELVRPLAELAAMTAFSPALLREHAALDAPTPDLAAQRAAVLQSAARRMQQAGDKARFSWSRDAELEAAYRRLFTLLTPYDIKGCKKVRIGGNNDGGYVMPDPGRDGIAYSFGVSGYSPWDRQMAERGFKVWQFDGTIDDAPDHHPNLFFFKLNISGKTQPPEGTSNISQILSRFGHAEERNIILQMDIEGAEWDVFETITDDQLRRFRQLIVEFHDLTNREKLPFYTRIFKKICKTHRVVHFHYNNNGNILGFRDFLVSSLFEITFVRRDAGTFTPSADTFPTAQDAPCITRYPEVHIGNFAVLTGRDTTPPRHMPAELRDHYTMGGVVPVIDYYLDNRRATPVNNTREVYDKTIRAIENGSFKYYGDTLPLLQCAFSEFSPAGKTVLVYGLAGCNCDALALAAGARRVVAVDYNPPRCDHPQVDVISMAELKKSALKADIAISISSFEHDGLGRYGDPLNPDGDLRAMEEAVRHLTPDGLLFLAVPTGPDCLAWNAHRIYGPRRLPLLLEKWTLLKSFGLRATDLTHRPLGNVSHQPVLVLSGNPAAVYMPRSVTPRQAKEIRDLAAHGAFDRAWYMRAYPDTLSATMDAVSHYVLHGAREGRNPAPWFDSHAYLTQNKDIAAAGMNPFWHYLTFGHAEGRRPR
ncbi:DUF268 domain-containing protein [uncultured Desulfovibrio sp.]|uniref:DUF268 domain-containing protein n=1 Tax=uncultured Desulfovibrio sp. TaxID=167968 RepID=UPI00260DE49B|nr:DUF268 domain-containing protein [uncultured Desulfovibrio sp.]